MILNTKLPAAMHTIIKPTIGFGCFILYTASINNQTVKAHIINIEAKAPNTSNL